MVRELGTMPDFDLAEHNDQALSWAGRALRESPGSRAALRVIAATHALTGQLPDANKAMLSLLELDPLRASDLGHVAPLRRTEDAARYAAGLRKAGLPE
jgi:hypothetical protein